MNKLAKLARKPAMKKVCGIFFAALMIVSMALPSFAAEGTPVLDESITSSLSDMVSLSEGAFSEILTLIVSGLSIGTILKFVGGALAIAIGFFIFWWGIRKVLKIVRKAFASGKVSV